VTGADGIVCAWVDRRGGSPYLVVGKLPASGVLREFWKLLRPSGAYLENIRISWDGHWILWREQTPFARDTQPRWMTTSIDGDRARGRGIASSRAAKLDHDAVWLTPNNTWAVARWSSQLAGFGIGSPRWLTVFAESVSKSGPSRIRSTIIDRPGRVGRFLGGTYPDHLVFVRRPLLDDWTGDGITVLATRPGQQHTHLHVVPFTLAHGSSVVWAAVDPSGEQLAVAVMQGPRRREVGIVLYTLPKGSTNTLPGYTLPGVLSPAASPSHVREKLSIQWGHGRRTVVAEMDGNFWRWDIPVRMVDTRSDSVSDSKDKRTSSTNAM